MFKKIALVCALVLAGCASPTAVAVQPVVPVKAEPPAWVVLKTANYSISVPPDFINVKDSKENLLDFVYKSPDSMLVLTLTTDQTTDDLDTYASAFVQAMINDGADLLQAKEGMMGGLRTALLVMGMNRRFITLHFLAQDNRIMAGGAARGPNSPKVATKVYYVSCAINPLMLKDKAATCLEITKSFTPAPIGDDAVHIRKLPE
jgi:hypothetical protein